MDEWAAFLSDAGWLGPPVAVAVFACLERAFPRFHRSVEARTPNLWFGFVTLVMTLACSVALTDIVARVAFPLRLANLADLPLPGAATIVLGLLLIDFLFYLNHLASHRLGLLWRLHKVHHADMFVSSTTGLLHHPLEVVWMFTVMLALNVMLGVPLGAVLIYGALNAIQLVFTHANIRLPERLSDRLGLVLVTPDMHMVHHSTDMREGNSNFGSILSVWDRLFGTLVLVPRAELARMELGLPDLRSGQDLRAAPLMRLPFRRQG